MKTILDFLRKNWYVVYIIGSETVKIIKNAYENRKKKRDPHENE